MYRQIKYVFLLSLLLILSVSCERDENKKKNMGLISNDLPASALKQLGQKKIYFGHRSVGNNIIRGIKDLMSQNPQIRLNIIAVTDKFNSTKGYFAHSRVGYNASPQSMAEGYSRLIDEVIGENADMALLVFTPFYGKNEVNEIFADYQEAIKQLRNKYPKTTFIHTTFPLMRSKTTWKTWIKKILGTKEIWEYDSNIKINKFNALIRNEYSEKEPFFDIAKTLSTFQNGTPSTFTKAGETYFHMLQAYTYDGTHLNERGRTLVAWHLLRLLASLCSDSS